MRGPKNPRLRRSVGLELSICHWFNITGPPEMFFPLDLGFLCHLGFWVFLAKSDKIWVSEALQFFTAFYYQFTDDTKFNGTETAVVMIFILLLFHIFCTTSAFTLWH